jgi:hypothetical protein
MADECIEFRKIQDRCGELKEWILLKGPQCLTEQKHLREGTQERAYWAHGYLNALLDVLRLFTRSSSPGQVYENREGSTQRRAA